MPISVAFYLNRPPLKSFKYQELEDYLQYLDFFLPLLINYDSNTYIYDDSRRDFIRAQSHALLGTTRDDGRRWTNYRGRFAAG